MALTVGIEGTGVVANSDSLTSDSAVGGSWLKLGTVTLSLSAETYKVGNKCATIAVSNKDGVLAFDYDQGGGERLQFVTGSHAGELVYMWVQLANPGLGESMTNGGTSIRFYSNSTNYREWIISASDDLNGWDGSWRCFVIDPTLAGSVADTGTYNANSVRYIAVRFKATTTTKGDNVFIDQIAVGNGLRITGTSTTGWKDAVDYCTDYANRGWGMLQEREGIYYAYGKIYIGDSTSQAADVSFTDSGRIIKFGGTEVYDTITASDWIPSAPSDYNGLVLEDITSYKTTFGDGVIVGSDAGRAGSTFIGHDDYTVEFDLATATTATSLVTLYGTTFSNIQGGITTKDDSDHKMYSCAVLGSEQFVTGGAIEIRNCLFAETTSTEAALYWSFGSDIENCTFIANTLGAGIEHYTNLTYQYYSMVFSGCTYDILYSAAASTGELKINKDANSVVSTYEITNATGNTVTIEGSATVKIWALKSTDKSAIFGARVLIEADDGGDLPSDDAVTIASTGTTATVTHTAHLLKGGDEVIIRGATESAYNGNFEITYISANSYSYTTLTTPPGSSATGSPTATAQIANGTTLILGYYTMTFPYASDQPIRGVVRDSRSPYYKPANFSGTIVATGYETIALMVPDE